MEQLCRDNQHTVCVIVITSNHGLLSAFFSVLKILEATNTCSSLKFIERCYLTTDFLSKKNRGYKIEFALNTLACPNPYMARYVLEYFWSTLEFKAKESMGTLFTHTC